MGRLSAKMYMPQEQQGKLQSHLEELGCLLEDQELAHRLFARMLGLSGRELNELRSALGNVLAHTAKLAAADHPLPQVPLRYPAGSSFYPGEQEREKPSAAAL